MKRSWIDQIPLVLTLLKGIREMIWITSEIVFQSVSSFWCYLNYLIFVYISFIYCVYIICGNFMIHLLGRNVFLAFFSTLCKSKYWVLPKSKVRSLKPMFLKVLIWIRHLVIRIMDLFGSGNFAFAIIIWIKKCVIRITTLPDSKIGDSNHSHPIYFKTKCDLNHMLLNSNRTSRLDSNH